jgi:hypothetical protein
MKIPSFLSCQTSSTILLLAASTVASAQWSVDAFGAGSLTKPFEVKVGKARSDSLNRVYVSERNGDVTEWTYTDSGWNRTLVYSGVKKSGPARNR